MGQFSVEKPVLPGSALSGNQQTDMMQLHLDEISRNVAKGTHAVLLLDRAGWHTTGKLNVPQNIAPIFLPSRARTQPGRECLAVSPSELALKHRLRKLRRHHRRRLRRMAETDRRANRITSIAMRHWAHVAGLPPRGDPVSMLVHGVF